MARRYKSEYRTYQKAYTMQARKVEKQKRIYEMAKRKKELIKERDEIKRYRKLTKYERTHYKSEIAKNTLNKANRKRINKEVNALKVKDLSLRSKRMDKIEFYATYESMKVELEKAGIKGDPMQYLVRQQAYKRSYEQWLNYSKQKRNYLEQEAPSIEIYEDEEWEESEITTPSSPFIEGTTEEDLNINQYEFMSGEADLSKVYDYEAMKRDYHMYYNLLKDSYAAQEEVAKLYWGS